MPPTPDPRLTPWKELFRRSDLHPHMPLMGTLVEMADKFSSAAGYLRELDPNDPRQADLGVKIGTLAARYFGTVVDNLGLGDGEQIALPANLFQARTLVDNVLIDVQGRIQAGWLANAEDGAVQDAENDARLESILSEIAPPSAAAAAGDKDVPVAAGQSASTRGKMHIDNDHFRVEWKGSERELEPGKVFKLIECLNTKPGKWYSHDELIDAVWDGDPTEPNTIQKTVSKLRGLLADMPGVAIETKPRYYRLTLS